MRKKVTLSILFVFLFFNQYAQKKDDVKVNTVSFELGKTGLLYNVSFDHRLKNKKIGYRFFIGSNFAKYLNGFSTGSGIYYLTGKHKTFFEVGVDAGFLKIDETSDDQRGLSLIFPNYSIKTFYGSINAGLRFYSKKSLFRTGLSPGIIKDRFLPGGYISLGFLF